MTVLVALALAATAQQAVIPGAPPQSDPHLQSVLYQPDRVVMLTGHLGLQTMIEFSPNERIENVAIGDATGWQVMPNKRADLLFVKPTSRGPATNMVVVTNQRTYAFALSVALARTTRATATWTLRFVIPTPPAVAAPNPPQPVTPLGKNQSYTLEGPEAVLPAQVFDDGRQTWFLWPEEVALPAIFVVNPDGSEALINFVMREGYVVVQQTAGRFVLRQGTAKATVTSTPGVARRLTVVKGRQP